MRRFIFASHHYLAYGLKDTVDFLTNKAKTIYDINAYAEDKEQNLESRVKELFDTFDPQDEVIVLTDLLGGSVYQKFYPYISERVHVLCGMNLCIFASMQQVIPCFKIRSYPCSFLLQQLYNIHYLHNKPPF